MTKDAIAAPVPTTGGPRDPESTAQHVAGWIFVVVLAMLVTQAGWFF